jgi:hypothetical protein
MKVLTAGRSREAGAQNSPGALALGGDTVRDPP